MITVHCFFDCGHTVAHHDPAVAHDLMEQHYETDHSEQVARIVGGSRLNPGGNSPCPPSKPH